MVKCIFLVKENDDIKEVIENKTNEEINAILTDKKYFSIHNVDEYIFLDKSFTKEEREQMVISRLISKSNERLKQNKSE